MTSFDEILRKLGYESYDEYLVSPHWIDFRRRYLLDSSTPKRCQVCNSKGRIQLHHCTYARLGKEKLEDVIPLCKRHHKAVHRWLDKQEKFKYVEFSCVAVRILKDNIKKPYKTKRRKKKPTSQGRRTSMSRADKNKWRLVNRKKKLIRGKKSRY